MKVINLTPHSLVVRDRTFPPSGEVARVKMQETARDTIVPGIGLIKTVTRTAGEVEGLPWYDDQGEAIYLVSSIVLDAVIRTEPWRNDVYAPDTGATAIRDDAGQIVAVTRLVSVPGKPQSRQEANLADLQSGR